MNRILGFFLLSLLVLPSQVFAYDKPGDVAPIRLDNTLIARESANWFLTLLSSPLATFLLYASVLGILVGLILRMNKLAVGCLIYIVSITILRNFSELFFNSFQSVILYVLIPVFLLIVAAKIFFGRSKEQELEDRLLEKLAARPQYKKYNESSHKEEDDFKSYGVNSGPAGTGKEAGIASGANIKLTRPF